MKHLLTAPLTAAMIALTAPAQAADDMTTHLINTGHRRIGFIKGHPNHMASDDRLFGYRRALDRAGLVGADGATHAGSFDIAYLACLPDMVVMAAADEAELMAGSVRERTRPRRPLPRATHQRLGGGWGRR